MTNAARSPRSNGFGGRLQDMSKDARVPEDSEDSEEAGSEGETVQS
jgi:hypothetical protein